MGVKGSNSHAVENPHIASDSPKPSYSHPWVSVGGYFLWLFSRAIPPFTQMCCPKFFLLLSSQVFPEQLLWHCIDVNENSEAKQSALSRKSQTINDQWSAQEAMNTGATRSGFRLQATAYTHMTLVRLLAMFLNLSFICKMGVIIIIIFLKGWFEMLWTLLWALSNYLDYLNELLQS